MATANSPLKLAAMAALLYYSTCVVRADGTPGAPGAPPAMDAVTLTGWLHVEDYDFDDAIVQVEVNGEVHSLPISKTGRIDLALPAGAEATLRFEHPGHLTKEVLVDTRFASEGGSGKHKRHVRFAVILELERQLRGQTYAGPVGNIGFEEQGGCLAIEHTKRLVVGRRNQPMVF